MTGADGNFPSPIRIRIYGNEVYLQDTIGYDDTNQKFTNEELKLKIRENSIKLNIACSNIFFILTHSFGDDRASLKRSFELVS